MPEKTILGDLKILETYVFYDGPRVFSCISLTDQIYLALWAAEGADGDDWLYLPISKSRLEMVRSGGIALRAAVEWPEGFTFRVFLPHRPGSLDSVEPISSSEIPEEWLPEEGYCLDLATHTLPLADPESVIETKARQESRTRLRLRVKLPKFSRSEAPARAIGALLLQTQAVYDNLGYALREITPSQRGKIPADVTGQTAISMVGASAASFMLEMASNELDDLLGESLFVQVTEKLIELLDMNLEYSELASKLAEIKPRAAKSFRLLVEKFVETGGDVTVAAAGAHIPYSKRELTSEKLHEFAKTLNRLVPEDQSIEIRRRMVLYKIDTERRTFGFRDESSNPADDYEGKIDDLAWPQASHATVQEHYDVLIVGTTVIDETVGERRTKYRLMQISHISGEVR
ncbi:DUF6575 domain-containing protein [Streptomyces sp. NRRL WC-3742]|uniref:DUF6575 domain-containing protein n=1 Tax=Streptomyces sp. NRRL WC-3742 TaxID=1463934 RepID=UPI00068F990A|nr:DUF6575 domain-containing protein [Streptomyces sp. NRRL WC-3742]